MKSDRSEVYAALDSERDYQDYRWGLTPSRGQHTVAEFILFMLDYLDQARHDVSRNPEPHAAKLGLDALRKVTAMGVACMEQNGVVKR